jgi:hypothetical protein
MKGLALRFDLQVNLAVIPETHLRDAFMHLVAIPKLTVDEDEIVVPRVRMQRPPPKPAGVSRVLHGDRVSVPPSTELAAMHPAHFWQDEGELAFAALCNPRARCDLAPGVIPAHLSRDSALLNIPLRTSMMDPLPARSSLVTHDFRVLYTDPETITSRLHRTSGPTRKSCTLGTFAWARGPALMRGVFDAASHRAVAAALYHRVNSVYPLDAAAVGTVGREADLLRMSEQSVRDFHERVGTE